LINKIPSLLMPIDNTPTDGQHPHRYWFPAKTYGWGWGFPSTWEGWLVLLAYLILLPVAVVLLPPDKNMPGFLTSVSGLSAILIAICWWKGEPAKWRWGGK
jgi:hypothetical protein